MKYENEMISEVSLGGKKTCLIAERDAVVASKITDYLSSLGYEIYPVVSSGEELTEKVKLLKPSLIITDINLKGQLDGIEAIAKLEETEHISYIFITAYDDYSRLINSYYLKPLSLIKKPVKNNDLIQSLEKVDIELV
jgi:DNA-binding NarL/FixJ family response regulator